MADDDSYKGGRRLPTMKIQHPKDPKKFWIVNDNEENRVRYKGKLFVDEVTDDEKAALALFAKKSEGGFAAILDQIEAKVRKSVMAEMINKGDVPASAETPPAPADPEPKLTPEKQAIANLVAEAKKSFGITLVPGRKLLSTLQKEFDDAVAEQSKE